MSWGGDMWRKMGHIELTGMDVPVNTLIFRKIRVVVRAIIPLAEHFLYGLGPLFQPTIGEVGSTYNTMQLMAHP